MISNVVNYKGYIEADAIHAGEADVVVCDGFVGNVTLKTTEGVARFIARMMNEAFMRNIFTKCIGLLVKPVLKTFLKRIDPSRYNGATFIGLNGTVVKSHGGANKQAFANAILEAMIGVEKNIKERIRHEVEQLLNPSPPTQGINS
jgi:glycerol-3-phosphate acyltransferase PlsX